MSDRWFACVCLVLAVAEMVVIVGSWVMGMLMPDIGVRSMLSGDSVRWFFSNFTSFVSGEGLAWVLLLSMAWSSFKACGIVSMRSHFTIDDKVALACAIVTLGFCVAVILLLSVVPHAALLSVSGSLYPSPLSKSLVAVVSFIVIFTSIVFGVMSGRYHSAADIFVPMCNGVSKSARLIVIYIFAAQFISTILYVW